MQVFLRKYGTSATVDYSIYSIDGANILTSATFTSGTCLVSKDGSPSIPSVYLPVFTNNNITMNFTQNELSCKRLSVKLIDSNITKTWLDTSFCIESYGTSASQHADLSSGLLDNIIDTVPLKRIITILLSEALGKIEKEVGTNRYIYFAQDNITELWSVSGASNTRQRLT